MDIAYEVAQYLDDAGFGTLGTDIFVGQLPTETNGVYVIRSGGGLNNYTPIIESIVEIYSAGMTAQTALQKIESIKNYIHRMYGTETDNAYIYTFLVLGDVEDVLRDEEYKKLYKITLQVQHRNTLVIS